jgi:hypothetical protein
VQDTGPLLLGTGWIPQSADQTDSPGVVATISSTRPVRDLIRTPGRGLLRWLRTYSKRRRSPRLPGELVDDCVQDTGPNPRRHGLGRPSADSAASQGAAVPCPPRGLRLLNPGAVGRRAEVVAAWASREGGPPYGFRVEQQPHGRVQDAGPSLLGSGWVRQAPTEPSLRGRGLCGLHAAWARRDPGAGEGPSEMVAHIFKRETLPAASGLNVSCTPCRTWGRLPPS